MGTGVVIMPDRSQIHKLALLDSQRQRIQILDSRFTNNWNLDSLDSIIPKYVECVRATWKWHCNRGIREFLKGSCSIFTEVQKIVVCNLQFDSLDSQYQILQIHKYRFSRDRFRFQIHRYQILKRWSQIHQIHKLDSWVDGA